MPTASPFVWILHCWFNAIPEAVPSLACWDGHYTESLCCDLTRGPQGNLECWSGQMTFENCCEDPSQSAELTTDPSLACWDEYHTESRCCDLQLGPQGKQECWSGGELIFENCCVHKLVNDEYAFILDKNAGGSLGMKLTGKDDKTLLIETLRAGSLMDAWNRNHVQDQISAGDCITEVNGLRDDPVGMVDELKQNKALSLSVVKLVRSRVSKVTVWAGVLIDMVGFKYDNGATRYFGRPGGIAQPSWTVPRGEFIVTIETKFGDSFDGIRFKTDAGSTSDWYGGPGFARNFTAASGNHIVALNMSPGKVTNKPTGIVAIPVEKTPAPPPAVDSPRIAHKVEGRRTPSVAPNACWREHATKVLCCDSQLGQQGRPECRSGGLKHEDCCSYYVPEEIRTAFEISNRSVRLPKDRGRPILSLELVLFLSHVDEGNFWNILAPSVALFGPNAPVVAVLEDSVEDRKFASSLPAGYRVHFASEFTSLGSGPVGQLKRRSMMKLLVDQISDAEYVGILDSEALFVSPVTEVGLFQGARPRVIAGVGYYDQSDPYLNSTTALLRRPEEIFCMAYSPMVLWRSHVAALRQHLEALHSANLEYLARNLDPIRADNALCNYIFWHHAESYSFHAYEFSPGWRGPLAPGLSNLTTTLGRLKPVQPAVGLSVHTGQMVGKHVQQCRHAEPGRCKFTPIILRKLLQGFCRSAKASGSAPPGHLCKGLLPGSSCDTLHRDLWRYRSLIRLTHGSRQDRRHQRSMMLAQLSHYQEVTKTYSVTDGERKLVELLEHMQFPPDQLLAKPRRPHNFELNVQSWEDAVAETAC